MNHSEASTVGPAVELKGGNDDDDDNHGSVPSKGSRNSGGIEASTQTGVSLLALIKRKLKYVVKLPLMYMHMYMNVCDALVEKN